MKKFALLTFVLGVLTASISFAQSDMMGDNKNDMMNTQDSMMSSEDNKSKDTNKSSNKKDDMGTKDDMMGNNTQNNMM